MNRASSIAIVGIGGIFPGSSGLDQFWANILECVDSAREVPEGRWLISPGEAFDTERGAPDKVYSTRGCFIEGFSPERISRELLISRDLVEKLDPMFHLALYAGHQAFRDAVTEDLNLNRVGVIIGNIALPTDRSSALAREYLGRTFEEKILGESKGAGQGPTHPLNRYVAGLPGGVLAKALGLGGGSYTLDAACASSLYALKLAADELLAGRANAMLTGGLSRPDCLYTQIGFSQLRALSPTGTCSPFETKGDGLVVGEGAGMFVMKRTEDALRHGDHIYAVIAGIGLSNDVGGSLLAPISEGQLRAIGPAYRHAGWSSHDVDIIECHATGTPVGDAVEFESLKTFWGKEGWDQGQCVIGSVKSNIGHLLTAAGSGALLKVLLALKHKTLPPTANFQTSHPGLHMDSSPFRVLTEPEPWTRRHGDIPRRAAVSAFGFGGINAHLLIEEWNPRRDCRLPIADCRLKKSKIKDQKCEIAVVGMDAHFGPWTSLRDFRNRLLGGSDSEEPGPISNWWGAEESPWFKDAGLDRFPFNGFAIEALFVPRHQFRIPPKELQETLPQQLIVLQVVKRAIADAGLPEEGRLRTGVFIGIGLDPNTTNFQLRWWLRDKAGEWSDQLGLDLSEGGLEEWIQSLRNAAGPPLTANRTMGALGGIVASRVAREFRLGGPGFTISSEESSGIRALDAAVRMLQKGDIDHAVVGAVDMAADIRSVLGAHSGRPFSKSGTIRPFDTRADGTIIGEGAAAIVLKRLEDARRDRDRIYAVIKGLGAASGGGVETCIPDVKTYRTSLERAFEDAGIDPDSVSYMETHGSGYPDEDQMEARALSGFFSSSSSPEVSRARSATSPACPKQGILPCALGSVKADIGHTGAASGLASLVKVCLCLHEEIIPPLTNFEQPREMDWGQINPESRFYFPKGFQYWMRNRAEGPRRAALGSFSVDGNCAHVILEEAKDTKRSSAQPWSLQPPGARNEALFCIEGDHVSAIIQGLNRLRVHLRQSPGQDMDVQARQWWEKNRTDSKAALGLALISGNRDEVLKQIDFAAASLVESPQKRIGGNGSAPAQPVNGDSVFFSPDPMGETGEIAFVFPGSGNHYLGMGRELSVQWPGVFRKQDHQNHYLRDQFLPELIWNHDSIEAINQNPKAAILCQVALGTLVSDLILGFGVHPDAAIGYSLGESAALFSLGAWTDRDGMLRRMNSSTLFTKDLAGPCNAARKAWNLPRNQEVDWVLGVIDVPAESVRKAIKERSRVYLLIVNTHKECLVGGNRKAVEALVEDLECRFFPLSGVTTVHCDVVRQVEKSYRDLHLFKTTPLPDIRFYSCAWGRAYDLNREKAADSILEQALKEIDFPRVVSAAYEDGVRIFLEMGPGNSCTRMIREILKTRPHVARSACFSGQDTASIVLRLLGQLIAERVPVDLNALYGLETPAIRQSKARHSTSLVIPVGGKPFRVSVPTRLPVEQIIRRMEAATSARTAAHEEYLRFSRHMVETMSENVAFQMSLIDAMKSHPDRVEAPTQSTSLNQELKSVIPVAFDRSMCLEFATGSISKVLGPRFAPVDTHPTRVRLPDEPLMLVDRIVSLRGEVGSLGSGRVITEHDILPGAWYLDGGHIPTCIAVEAGQADLFLSAYLGIDFKTKGLAVYRLLDAVVTFHRELPAPGAVIRYDIRIESFFRQGETYFFRFSFEGSVDGEPLLTMKEGCAGFFTAEELAAGKGITRAELDRRPMEGVRPEGWETFVPMFAESYNDDQINALRSGGLETCFGRPFSGLGLKNPLRIPSGRFKLVHRVLHLDPEGGRFGLGIIRGEADINPDEWFLTCHFPDDLVMPGTLMYECCLHTLRIFLLRMGWVGEQDDVVCTPVPGIPSRLKCRGQVIPSTEKVVYEISLKEVGYRPEPYAIADALMFADGKPIVEMADMSICFPGLTLEKIRDMWEGRGQRTEDRRQKKEDREQKTEGGRKNLKFETQSSKSEIPFDHDRILAFAIGKPSDAFGEPYKVFDRDRVIARLPGPPYQFLDRITQIHAEPWEMVAGGVIESEYHVPPDAWYFSPPGETNANGGVSNPNSQMPFAVLLEVALQPCGWLAAYMGTALTSDMDLAFRNLGGNALQYEPVMADAGTLTTSVKITKVSASGGMTIQNFDFEVLNRGRTIYKGDTYFGFFSKKSLKDQAGISGDAPYNPGPDEVARQTHYDFPPVPPLPSGRLRMVDQVDLFIPDGGPKGLGFIRGLKKINPDEWFFKAHFYQDPVWPGSLGLESFLQLLEVVAADRWGSQIMTPATGEKHAWVYRGQVIPDHKLVTIHASVSSVDDETRMIRADGLIVVDGLVIYRMNDFGLTTL